MKKVLVTGAAGTLGKKVLKYLLIEGKYDIYALDLKTRHNRRVLKKYKRRINIIYGDVTDTNVLENVIKDVNYVIHLAGVMPPLANLNDNLPHEVDFRGTENIVRLIDFYNPSCHLFYASSSCVYGVQKDGLVSTSTKIDYDSLSYYTKAKIDSENIIKEKLGNYTLFRLPLVLCNPIKDNYLYTYKTKNEFEIITDDDAGYMFTRSLLFTSELNKKTYNVGGGKACYTTGLKLNNAILKYYGFTSKYIKTKMFYDKDYGMYIFKDSDKLENILSFRRDSIGSYLMREKRKSKSHPIRKFIGKPFIKKK